MCYGWWVGREMEWGRWKKGKEKRKKEEGEEYMGGDIVPGQLKQAMISSLIVKSKKIC